MPVRYRRRFRPRRAARRPARRYVRRRRLAKVMRPLRTSGFMRASETYRVDGGVAGNPYSYSTGSGQSLTVALDDLPTTVRNAYNTLYQFFRLDAVKVSFVPCNGVGEANQFYANAAGGVAAYTGPLRLFFIPSTMALPVPSAVEDAMAYSQCKMRILGNRGATFIIRRPKFAVDLATGIVSEASFQNSWLSVNDSSGIPWYCGQFFMDATGNANAPYNVYVTLLLAFKSAH